MGKAIVLVVEDEALLRLNAVDEIEAAGFEVIDVADADEAIRILETNADVRIVFTDIDLPGGMDGIRLAAAIRDRWPPVELILTSGQHEIAAADLPERGMFFSKPTDWRKVVAAMRRFAASI